MKDYQINDLIRYGDLQVLKRKVTRDRLLTYCHDRNIDCSDCKTKELMINKLKDSLFKFPDQTHISYDPVNLDHYRNIQQRLAGKPTGFWFAPGEDWYRFAHRPSGGWRPINDHVRFYRVILAPNSYTKTKRRRKGRGPKKIFVVEGLEDVKYIENEYRVTDFMPIYLRGVEGYKQDLVDDYGDGWEDEYEQETPEEIEAELERLRYNDKTSSDVIDWAKFAERYGGIEIRNNTRNRRFRCKHRWYADFDVNSTCVWNLPLIEELIEIPHDGSLNNIEMFEDYKSGEISDSDLPFDAGDYDE